MKKQLKTTKPQKPKRHIDYGRILFTGFLAVTVMAASSMNVFAAETVWQKANQIMKDVYTQILTISTIAAIVTGIYRFADDEFFQIRQDGGRIPCLAETNYHYLGDS